jgi:hypothetical protein
MVPYDKYDGVCAMERGGSASRNGAQRHLLKSRCRRWARIATCVSYHCLRSLLDVFVMHVRAQNAAVIVRVLKDYVRFEMFEVSPPKANVDTSTTGKFFAPILDLQSRYPLSIFSKECFLLENLLLFSSKWTPTCWIPLRLWSRRVRRYAKFAKALTQRYISELLVGILRGFGEPAVGGSYHEADSEMRSSGKTLTSLGVDRRYGL